MGSGGGPLPIASSCCASLLVETRRHESWTGPERYSLAGYYNVTPDSLRVGAPARCSCWPRPDHPAGCRPGRHPGMGTVGCAGCTGVPGADAPAPPIPAALIPSADVMADVLGAAAGLRVSCSSGRCCLRGPADRRRRGHGSLLLAAGSGRPARGAGGGVFGTTSPEAGSAHGRSRATVWSPWATGLTRSAAA
jgi:hypothetical protein